MNSEEEWSVLNSVKVQSILTTGEATEGSFIREQRPVDKVRSSTMFYCGYKQGM